MYLNWSESNKNPDIFYLPLLLLPKKDAWHNLCSLADFIDIKVFGIRPSISSDTTVDGIGLSGTAVYEI